jgi:hypothetical protein
MLFIIIILFCIYFYIIIYIINLIRHLALSSMVFEMEMHCDSCEVRTDYLNVIYYYYFFCIYFYVKNWN